MLTKKNLLLLLIATQMIGCAGDVKKEHQQPENLTEATFFDSGVFDQDLSSKLSQNPDKFVIKPSTPLNVNKLPERVDRWLSKIKQENGNVQLKEYSPTPTKDMSLLMDMAVKLFDLAQDKIMYNPAKEYDAIVEYEKSSGVVKQIMLYKKK